MFNIKYLINPSRLVFVLPFLVFSGTATADVKVGDKATWVGWTRQGEQGQSSSQLTKVEGSVTLQVDDIFENKYELSLHFEKKEDEDLTESNPALSRFLQNIILKSEISQIDYRDFFPVLRLPLLAGPSGKISEPKISITKNPQSDTYQRFLGKPTLYEDCTNLSPANKDKSYFNKSGYVSNFTTTVHSNRNVLACTISKSYFDRQGWIAVFVPDFNYGPIEIRQFTDVKKWKVESEKIDLPNLNISGADTVLQSANSGTIEKTETK